MINVSAQVGIDETVIPKSPNAASLDRLDFSSFDLATGGTSISYNLYTVKTKSISVPVQLVYHSGGIKVDEIASSVGLGWALNVGGLISRKINGNPDEGITLIKGKRYFLYSSTYGILNTPNAGGLDTSSASKKYYRDLCLSKYKKDVGTVYVGSDFYGPKYLLATKLNYWGGYSAGYVLNGLNTYPQLYQDILNINADPNKPALPNEDNIFTSNLVDPQPDEFTIIIPGYSGKFSFNSTGVPQLNPVDKSLKITFSSHKIDNDSIYKPIIDGWVITTTDGKKYYFGYDINSLTTSDVSFGNRRTGMNLPIIEWYLTKILDVNTMDSLTFSYKKVRAGTGRPYKEYIYQNNSSNCDMGFEYVDTNAYRVRYYGEGCSASILTKITTSKEILNFFTTSSPLQLPGEGPKLDSVIVTDLFTNLVACRFTLNYDFFKMSGKLKLTAFQRQSIDQVNMQPPTLFSYYDTLMAYSRFPNRDDTTKTKYDTVGYTSFAQDYWGYYNNAQQNYNGFFVYPASCSLNVNRKAAWPHMQLGVLNKITSPTGGQTILSYEPHTASSYIDETGNISYEDRSSPSPFIDNPFPLDTIGGLRIKKITLIDSIGKISLIKQFFYNNPYGNSSGHLNITPSVTQRISQPLCFTSPSVTDYILISNQNRTPIHSYAATVNYSCVTEKITDSTGNSNGYTTHTYYNDANIPDTSFLSNNFSGTQTGYRYPFNGLGNMPSWLSHHSIGVNLLNGYEISQKIYSNNSILLQKHSNIYSVKQCDGMFLGFNFFGMSLDDVCYSVPHEPFNYYGNSSRPITNDDDYENKLIYPNKHIYYYIKYYAEYPKNVFLTTSTDVKYNAAGDSLTNIQQLYYESPYHQNNTRSVSYTSKGDTLTTVSLYAFDYADAVAGDTSFKQMKTQYYNPLISTTSFKGNQISGSKLTKYQNFGTSPLLALYPVGTYLHRANLLITPLQTFGVNNTVSS